MSGEVISFTTVEYPDETSMLKAREVFQLEMGQLADKWRPLGMTEKAKKCVSDLPHLFNQWRTRQDDYINFSG